MMQQDKQTLVDAAIEAERLRTDPAFAAAVMQMRKDAIERLIVCDATDTATVLRHQSDIRAIDSLCDEIATAIHRGTPRRPPPVA